MLELLAGEMIYLVYYFEIQLQQLFWYWLLGMLLGSFVSVFLKEPIHQRLATMGRKKTGIWVLAAASALGIASPLCMYGTIPLAASFSKSGMKDDLLAAFMMSSILLNPQLLMYSAALGQEAWLIRIIACFLCGIAAGLLVRIFYPPQGFFNFSGFAMPESHDTDPRPLVRYVKNVWRNIKVTGGYFLLGMLLAVLFQRYVPSELMTNIFGGDKAWGVLMAATIGVPLYACGGGTIPLLQAWLADGMSLGGATAFMLTGPATKITNLGAVKIVLGMRHFCLYLVFIMLFAFASGLLVNLFF